MNGAMGREPGDERALRVAENPGLLPRVLVLLAPTLRLQPLRTSARTSGFAVLFQGCETTEALEASLTDRPQAVLCLASEPQLLRIVSAARASGAAAFAVIENGAPRSESFEQARPLMTGTLRPHQLKWLPMYLERAQHTRGDQGQADHVERRLQEAAQSMSSMQKLAAMGRMAGTIAHEINNPLESVTNLLYLIHADGALPEHLREYVQMAERELARVAQISKQTLNFYRETKTPVRMNLNSLLDEVMVLFGPRLRERGITPTREESAGEIVGMTLFPGEMRQVFANLIGNAIEASEPGARLRLRVRPARRWDDPGVEGLRITVGDTGSGVPAGVRKQLGSPFFTTKGQRGTGLGLWVSRGIVERNGGTMNMRSSTDPMRHGTVFSIFLPTNMRPQAVIPA